MKKMLIIHTCHFSDSVLVWLYKKYKICKVKKRFIISKTYKQLIVVKNTTACGKNIWVIILFLFFCFCRYINRWLINIFHIMFISLINCEWTVWISNIICQINVYLLLLWILLERTKNEVMHLACHAAQDMNHQIDNVIMVFLSGSYEIYSTLTFTHYWPCSIKGRSGGKL